ncbi:MAG: FAD/NAD(P)-binding oxidoreductase [Candidatus Altiarchaeales archaeon WOR_SM1_86-2]|nr:MAG: FAD/NAD(P)-binding oxidoreductase [Candidatus Altiarchaeales archaeon WOR_SM1_86-2]
MHNFDVIIIGGGVVGCAIARELSKYKVKAALLEKESDVAMGASGANSGVVHAGFYVRHGTLKAKMNMGGHRLFERMCGDLDVPYKKVGKLIVAKNEDEIEGLSKLKDQGDANGVRGLKIIKSHEIKKLEPNVNGTAALYSPNSAITSPYLLTIALAENAKDNGIEIFLDTEVIDIEKTMLKGHKGGETPLIHHDGQPSRRLFLIKTNRGEFKSKFVVSSAGIHSDEIAKMVGIYDRTVVPCRGEYFIMDKDKGNLINSMIYPVPPKDPGGLGVHLTSTIDHNILIGPSAEFIDEKDNTKTTTEIMDQLYGEARELIPEISNKDFITAFSGIRARLKESDDFVIEESRKVPGFINLMGIESPGLTAAPAIAKKVVEMLKEDTRLKPNPTFNPKRKCTIRFDELPDKEKSKRIEENPDHGEIVCRCENVTKQEIIDALNNPLGVRTVKGIKYRARAGMGRCQGGFCLPRIVEIMREDGIKTDEVMLKGKGSYLFVGKTKS